MEIKLIFSDISIMLLHRQIFFESSPKITLTEIAFTRGKLIPFKDKCNALMKNTMSFEYNPMKNSQIQTTCIAYHGDCCADPHPLWTKQQFSLPKLPSRYNKNINKMSENIKEKFRWLKQRMQFRLNSNIMKTWSACSMRLTHSLLI